MHRGNRQETWLEKCAAPHAPIRDEPALSFVTLPDGPHPNALDCVCTALRDACLCRGILFTLHALIDAPSLDLISNISTGCVYFL
jgi:hypothetical protein